jgi:uncharacterized membrane protein YphA (DoxX/SURF4 family)
LLLKRISKGYTKILLSPWLHRLTRFALGSVFVYSGFIKLIDPKAFAKAISQYDLLPESLLAPVAIGLPALEFLAGLGLIFAVRGSLSIIFSLLIMFVVILWYGALNNLNIDCGCFSPEELKNQAGLWHAFYRDLVMIVAVLYLYLSRWVQSGRKIHLSLLTKIHQN